MKIGIAHHVTKESKKLPMDKIKRTKIKKASQSKQILKVSSQVSPRKRFAMNFSV